MTCEHEEHVHESCQHQTTYLHEKLRILRDLQYRIDKSGKSKRLTHQFTAQSMALSRRLLALGLWCLGVSFLSETQRFPGRKDHPDHPATDFLGNS